MWRVRAARPGLWLAIGFAVLASFLLGNWQASRSRAADLSASEKVALRFPEPDLDQPIAAKAAGTAPMILGDKDLALFSSEPMLPQPILLQTRPRPAQLQSAAPAITVSLAPSAAAPVHAVPAAVVPKREAKVAVVNTPRSAPKTEADATSRRGSRPGFLLNDAQIASIKSRLHLTPDQEGMWPAVEAALRNIAYAKAQVARRHGDDRGADVASLDPDSAAVQGLKSAAVPLIMSFSEDQKSEVRSLAHVMGLDKLASEF